MAWKVYGCMHGRDKGGKADPAIYGPLPVKVWVKRPGEKRPRVKKAKVKAESRGRFDKDDQDRKAVQYARWLAARDGVALPEGSITTVWAEVLLPSGKIQLRPSCVMFNGAFPRVRIDIPNWNFVAREPVETVDPLPARDEMDSMFERGFRLILQAEGFTVPIMGDNFQMVA